MEEPTLGQLLANLTEAVGEYQGVVNRMFEIHSQRLDLHDRIVTELRDDSYESMTALSNRVEALARALTTEPAEVAARIVTDANRGLRDVNS